MSHLSNKEQADLVKAFWNNYGRWMAIAILIGLLVGFGWRWYDEHRERQELSASILYNQLLNASMSGPAPEPVDAAIMQRFKKDFPTSTYRELAELLLARQDIGHGNLVQAEQVLQSSIHAGANSALIDLARVRLARLQLAAQNPQGALKTLKSLTKNTSDWMQLIADIEFAKVYEAMNDEKQAREIRENVQTKAKSLGIDLPGYILLDPK
jgi:predicted negative regulator of RcsB-dependent stress response